MLLLHILGSSIHTSPRLPVFTHTLLVEIPPGELAGQLSLIPYGYMKLHRGETYPNVFNDPRLTGIYFAYIFTTETNRKMPLNVL